MRNHTMHTFSYGLLVLLFSGSLLGCLTKVDSSAGTTGKACEVDKNCRDGFRCVNGTCQKTNAGDAGSKSDGPQTPSDVLSAASDSKADLGSTVKLDTNAMPDATPEANAPDASAADEDAPALVPDAPEPEPDASISPDTRPADASQPDTLPCNGGCCSSADCPLTKPVCSANKCIGCTADTDCTGRSLTACKVSTGACVQCTQKSHCGGTASSCDTATNQCVGCTSRSDCPGTCQTCSSGSCISVKNADDPGKCAGTCDSAGECKAKQGQKCTDVTGGCISGTTCADGTCCNRACAGTCEACDLPNALGTCTVLTAGSQPRHGTCANTGTGVANATCAGSCQGKSDGTCTYAANTIACGTAGCATNTSSQAAGTCNGTGLCSMPAPISCKTGGTCSAGACSCPASLPNECGGACVNTNTDGKNCGACGHDCSGGECLGGICQPVVVTKPSVSYSLGIFGLDSQYLYYSNSAAQVNATEIYRISSNALNGTGSLLRGAERFGALGVIGSVLYFPNFTGMPPRACQLSDCASTLADLTTVGKGSLPRLDIPAPTNYAVYGSDEGDPFTMLRLTWYDTSNQQVTTWLDTTTNTGDSSFVVSGSSVTWIRADSTNASVYTIDSTSKILKRLATKLPTGNSGILNINAQSLLLVSYGNSSLYRIPLPQGTGTSTPPIVLSAAASFQSAVEDANFIFWTDNAGSIYKCATSDLASCESKRILLTTGAPTTGLIQDAKYLYWGTAATGTTPNGQLLRMAK
jgi:hypothetical protein